jgi:hypothetical protein
MLCRKCGSSSFRLSRLRLTDCKRFIVLQLPVRCRKCTIRSFVNVFDFVKIWQEGKLRHAERRRKAREEGQ